MRKIIIGNWKMNPGNLENAKKIFRSTKNVADKLNSIHVIACPPFVYISTFAKSRAESKIAIGAQDVFFEGEGSYTGEVSASMLKDLGVTHCIVGHSEKRKAGDTDEIVSKKVKALLEAGIHPVVCIGEKEHDPQGSYLETLKNQIKNSLSKVQKKNIHDLIIAYEPIWAIGAKEAMQPETVNETVLFIKKVLADMYGHDEAMATPILYGGSVNFRNAGDIVTRGGVDGLLVGRESVNPPGFSELLKTIDSL
jgi:triosephosphate isomerase